MCLERRKQAIDKIHSMYGYTETQIKLNSHMNPLKNFEYNTGKDNCMQRHLSTQLNIYHLVGILQ